MQTLMRVQTTIVNSDECICDTTPIYITFICGILLGTILNNYWKSVIILIRKRYKKKHVTENDKSIENEPPLLDYRDGGFQVLEETLSFISENIQKTRTQSKVVEYMSPDEMLSSLFCKDGKFSLKLGGSTITDSKENIKNMNKCLQAVHKYSVNTNHPFFFNQLFGTLDPVALAAELLAISINTSNYTYETAPVFTLMERDLFSYLSKIVFGPDVRHDGLMLPGGSLSNMTALHVARFYTKQIIAERCYQIRTLSNRLEEEKKQEDHMLDNRCPIFEPELVAFVSSEAHYSFAKSIGVTGIGKRNLIVVPTLPNGEMDIDQLDFLMIGLERDNELGGKVRIPFFVAATSGSTVRGSFDDLEGIVNVCKKHENRLNSLYGGTTQNNLQIKSHKIWVHVDGAWGGNAIFSSRTDLQALNKGLEHVDSFTFNPHKMLGAPQQTTAFLTRHAGILRAANSAGAKYLFDSRKNGAEFDLGDGSYTCGRRPDVIKLWAQLKFYGADGLGRMLESKVDALKVLTYKIQQSEKFMLACNPWPFNVNFFYIPERIRHQLIASNVDIASSNPIIPDEISNELSQISVALKLRLHKSGVMLIPYQPLSNQKADCFRIVIAGKKTLTIADIDKMLALMDQYGCNL